MAMSGVCILWRADLSRRVYACARYIMRLLRECHAFDVRMSRAASNLSGFQQRYYNSQQRYLILASVSSRTTLFGKKVANANLRYRRLDTLTVISIPSAKVHQALCVYL
jgi:hypothetical protein